MTIISKFIKNKQYFLSAAALLFLNPLAQADTPTFTNINGLALGKAIIVVRHAEENTPASCNSIDKAYPLPAGEGTAPSHQRCLLPNGVKCSQQLATLLPKFLSDHNLKPVSRIITKDPAQPDTPNPFETATPFFPIGQPTTVQEVKIYDDLGTNEDPVTEASEVANDLTSPNNGSLLIIYDKEHLWGGNDKSINNDLILGKLNKQLVDYPNNLSAFPANAQPCKCIDLYVYTLDLNLKGQVNVYSITNDGQQYKSIVKGKQYTCY